MLVATWLGGQLPFPCPVSLTKIGTPTVDLSTLASTVTTPPVVPVGVKVALAEGPEPFIVPISPRSTFHVTLCDAVHDTVGVVVFIATVIVDCVHVAENVGGAPPSPNGFASLVVTTSGPPPASGPSQKRSWHGLLPLLHAAKTVADARATKMATEGKRMKASCTMNDRDERERLTEKSIRRKTDRERAVWALR